MTKSPAVFTVLALLFASQAYSAQIDFSVMRQCKVSSFAITGFSEPISVGDIVASSSSHDPQPIALKQIIDFNSHGKPTDARISLYIYDASSAETTELVAYSNLAFDSEDGTSLTFSTPKDIPLPPGSPNEGSTLIVSTTNGNDDVVTLSLDEYHLSAHRTVELSCSK